MSDSKPTLWTRDFSLLTLSNFLMAAGSFLLIPTLPIYAEKVLNADKSEIGYIMGFYTLSSLLVRPFVGIALDTVGRKPVYLFGLLFFILLMPVYYFTTVMVLLFGLRLLHGITWGIITTGGSTIAADLVPPLRRGEGIGYFGMSFTVSMAIGPVIGLWLIEGGDYQRLFFTATGLVFFTFLIAYLIRYPDVVLIEKPKRITKSMLYDAAGVPASLIAMVCSGVYGGLVTFITLYSQELGIRNGSLFFIVYAVGLTIIRPLAGVQMDKYGPKKVIGFGLVALIIGLTTLASIQEIIGFLIASFITGVGMGVIFPTTLTMIVNLVEPERRGVANSTFFSAVDIGVGIGSILLGILADATSIAMSYYVSAGLIVIPLLYFFAFVLKDYEKKMGNKAPGAEII